MGDVYDFQAAKNKKQNQNTDPLFQKQVDRMDRLQLMEEMIKYNDKRKESKDPNGLFWIIRGIILFTAIEHKCETNDMKALASSYRRHLQIQLDEKNKKK